MKEKIEILKNWINESDNIVFFGGAGVSTESGIPDFRSEEGIFNTVKKYYYNPEYILSHTFFKKNPEIFFEYYKENLIFENALPNNCHKALLYLEKIGKLKGIITQNIDGIHQKAGSNNVFELHGNIYENYCIKCGENFNLEYILEKKGVPLCNKCNGIVRPNIVLYEEPLDDNVIKNSIKLIEDSDLLIVGGTSLNVYPANSFLNYYKGKKLVLINKSKTPFDYKANLIINHKIGEIFEKIIKIL